MSYDSHHSLQTTITHKVCPEREAMEKQQLEDQDVLCYALTVYFEFYFTEFWSSLIKPSTPSQRPGLWPSYVGRHLALPGENTGISLGLRISSSQWGYNRGCWQPHPRTKAWNVFNVSPNFCLSQHKKLFTLVFLHKTYIRSRSLFLIGLVPSKARAEEMESNYWLNYFILLMETHFNNQRIVVVG